MFCDNSFILKLQAYIAPSRLEVASWLSRGDVIMAPDRPQIRFQIGANHSEMTPRLLLIALDSLIALDTRLIRYSQVAQFPISSISGEESIYSEALLPHVEH